MKLFEYKKETVPGYQLSDGSFLNSFGEQGWELVSVLDTGVHKGDWFTFFFKRELVNTGG